MSQLKPVDSLKQYIISLFICIFLLSQALPVEYLDSKTTKMYDHLQTMPDDFYMYVQQNVYNSSNELCCSLIYENSTDWAYIAPDNDIFAVSSTNQGFVQIAVRFSHHSSNDSYNEIDVSFISNSTSVEFTGGDEFTLPSEDILGTHITIYHTFIRNSNDEVVNNNNTFWFSGSAVSDSGNLLKQKDFEITLCYGVMRPYLPGNSTINPYFFIDNPDGDLLPSMCDSDDDGDGWLDSEEPLCGTDSLNSNSIPTDTDDDGICDALDPDIDGDGFDNAVDAFPEDSLEWFDTDGDGTGNNADMDDDNDGYDDATDAFDNDADAWTDTDGDGLADDFPNLSQATVYQISGYDVFDSSLDERLQLKVTHSDGTVLCSLNDPPSLFNSSERSCPDITLQDGSMTVKVSRSGSVFEIDPYSWNVTIVTPSGTSTTYNYSDLDCSSTGTCYESGETLITLTELTDPYTPSSSPAGTVLDLDDDGDGLSDADEATAGTDSLDTDTDDDGDDDLNDQFPLDATEWDDTDSDGMGDNEDAFPTDACATVDTDGDGMPDALVAGCTTTLTEDTDDDNDGKLDLIDRLPLDSCATDDYDNDGRPDSIVSGCLTSLISDSDDDNDGFSDVDDAFPNDHTEWLDSDADGFGNNIDAFPYDSTEWLDWDADGFGDNVDAFPYDPTEWLETTNDDSSSESADSPLGFVNGNFKPLFLLLIPALLVVFSSNFNSFVIESTKRLPGLKNSGEKIRRLHYEQWNVESKSTLDTILGGSVVIGGGVISSIVAIIVAAVIATGYAMYLGLYALAYLIAAYLVVSGIILLATAGLVGMICFLPFLILLPFFG